MSKNLKVKQKRSKKESAREIARMMKDPNFPYRRGNIVWIDIPEELKGATHVQAGLRRGLIFSNDVNNLFSDLIYIIPCTTRHKHMKLHVWFDNQLILAEQLNPIDKSWILLDKGITRIDDETMKRVEVNFQKQFGLIPLARPVSEAVADLEKNELAYESEEPSI